MKRKLIALTGAGISAESGLKTFRDSDGLWEGYDIEEVATPDGFIRDPALVLKFYNERRRDVIKAKPNAGHFSLVELEEYFDVTIITQNIDDLHERAGSRSVIHLHGEILKARSSINDESLVNLDGADINLGDLAEDGSQLRPHVVWFGEAVPNMSNAIDAVKSAQVLIVVGTSLVVYPAASLVSFVSPRAPVYVIDPSAPEIYARQHVKYIRKPASTGVSEAAMELLNLSRATIA